MHKYRLNQAMPWSRQDLYGFIAASVGSGILLTVIAEITVGADRPISASYVLAFGMGIPVLLNAPTMPFKSLPWQAQWFACWIISMVGVTVKDVTFAGSAIGFLLAHALMGTFLFLIFRVNWWYHWDNPSRRTLGEKIVLSIFHTGIPVFGLAMGFWRLVGIGVQAPTTVFETSASGDTVETIPENPALAEHARRKAAVRAGQTGAGTGRTGAENKDAISQSI